MEYRGEGVAALVSITDDMQTANLIMVDKKVKDLLRCLAYYDEFRTVLQCVNRGFDYQAEKRKAMQKVGDYNVLRLPKSEKTLVALVSNMLVEFDNGKMDIIAFASVYFPATTNQESYEEFVAGVIDPFKLALVSLVVGGIEEETPLVERTVEFAPSGLGTQTQSLLIALVNSVNEAQLDAETRAELLLILEGFAAALDSRDSLIIKSIWLGLRRTLSSLRICEREIARMNEVMLMYLMQK